MASPAGLERTVLVVEDEPTIRLIMRLALSDAGFQIIEADSGRGALAALDAAPIDAVILDPGLPDGLGGAVIQRLDDLYEEEGAPIWYLLSASDEERLRQRFGDFSGPFVAKPFDPLRLVSVLASTLESGGSLFGRRQNLSW
jgi:two-component system chemotaxis response regulator CheY